MTSSLFFAISTFAIGLVDLAYALYIFSRYQRTPHIKLFSAFVLLLAGWMITNGIEISLGGNKSLVEIIGRSIFVIAGLAFTVFYLFTKNYPFPNKKMSVDEVIVTFLPWLLVSGGLYFSKSLVVGFEPGAYSYTIFGPSFWLYILYALIMTAASGIVMLRTQRKLEGVQARGVRQMFWYSVITAVVGITTSLIAPDAFHTKESPWAIMVVALIWVVLLGKIITRSETRQSVVGWGNK